MLPAGVALHEALKAASVERTGPTFLRYEERPDGSLTPVVAAPIGDQSFTATTEIDVTELPAIDAVVAVVAVRVGTTRSVPFTDRWGSTRRITGTRSADRDATTSLNRDDGADIVLRVAASGDPLAVHHDRELRRAHGPGVAHQGHESLRGGIVGRGAR